MQTTYYRPISLISNFAKIFKKLIHDRLYEFFIHNNILSSRQFGFVKNVGIKEALATISNYIHENLNNSKHTIVTFLDLWKAFDTVNFKILLIKLNRLGIRGKALNLTADCLRGRMQLVRVNDVYSGHKVGVPQGSLLGLFLFTSMTY